MFAIDCSNAEFCVSCVCVLVCVCVCVRERERETWSHPNRGLCTANTYELHHCVCHATLFPLGLELMVKLRTLLTVFIFILKAKACDNGKGHYISDSRLWCSSNHIGSAGQSEQTALVRRRDFVKNEAFERGGAERTYNNVQYLKNCFLNNKCLHILLHQIHQ